MTLGTTKYPMGFTAMTRSASICSVTFIVPNSAVIAAPTRPANTTPANTGPSSRPIAMAIIPPTVPCAPYRINTSAICNVITAPAKNIVRLNIGNELTPKCAICSIVSFQFSFGTCRMVRHKSNIASPICDKKKIILLPIHSSQVIVPPDSIYHSSVYHKTTRMCTSTTRLFKKENRKYWSTSNISC